MTSNSQNGNLRNLKPHAQYYHPGGDLKIIIDDTSFCVASYFFTRESPIFRERLQTETGKGTAEGLKADKQTIVIQPSEKVTADDFEKLCWVFYNGNFGVYDASLETWKVILRLATQYKFPEVKNLALRELDPRGKFKLTLVERVILYHQIEADKKYLEPLYTEILSRPEPLTLEEGSALGMPLVIHISKAREHLRATCGKLTPTTPLPDAMKKTVSEMIPSIPWNELALNLGLPNGASGNASGSSSSSANTKKSGTNGR